MSYADAKAIATDRNSGHRYGVVARRHRRRARHVARQLLDAAETVGFFYVRNHGIPQDSDCAHGCRRAALLLVAPGRKTESQSGAVAPRLHQGRRSENVRERENRPEGELHLGNGGQPDDAETEAESSLRGPNQWPDSVPEMRPTLNEFFDRRQSMRQGPVSRIRRKPGPRPGSLHPAVRSADYAWSARLLPAAAAGSRRRSVRRRAAHGLRLPDAGLPGSDRRAAGAGPQRRMGHRPPDRRHAGRQHRRLDGAVDERSIQVHRRIA